MTNIRFFFSTSKKNRRNKLYTRPIRPANFSSSILISFRFPSFLDKFLLLPVGFVDRYWCFPKDRGSTTTKPLKISNLELLIRKEQMVFFERIGLGEIVSCGKELLLTLDGLKLPFSQIAGLK